jgi:hypothetical protein
MNEHEAFMKEVFENSLNELVPENDYRNGVIATALTYGHKDRLTREWLKEALLRDYNDCFIALSEVRKEYLLYKEYLGL